MSEHFADPRRVIEVLLIAAEMLAHGAEVHGVVGNAVHWMGITSRLSRSDQQTDGTALRYAALRAAHSLEVPLTEGYGQPAAERRQRLLAAAALVRRHILSVSLFCGALPGSWDSALTDLLAQWLAGEDALGPLLDLAEERGLDGSGVWPVVEREWPRVDKHGTGDNPHMWLPRSARACDDAEIPLPLADPRCPCGMFRHEHEGARA